ncbi:MAG: hypothetical protein EBZ48_02685 [Proteobacteria bacterium]|nr:hypothetical protein [Pseudomonadota bacterium]
MRPGTLDHPFTLPLRQYKFEAWGSPDLAPLRPCRSERTQKSKQSTVALRDLLSETSAERSYVSLPPPQSTDFLQYWTAFQLVQQGQNPYDPQLMLALQKSLGLTAELPVMMWNPPWLLLLLSPVLHLELSTALAAWRIISLLLSIASCLLLLRSINSKHRSANGFFGLLTLGASLSLWWGIET